MVKIFFSLVLLGALCGCSIFPKGSDIAVNYFDLGFPSSPDDGSGMHFSKVQFENSGPYYQKMAFRQGSNQLMFDEFNRWTVRPSGMLENYFNIRFQESAEEGKKSNGLTITGQVLRFEMNLDKTSADLAILVSVSDSEGKERFKKIYTENVIAKDKSASAFATAMSEAVSNAIAKIDSDTKKLVP